MVIMHVYKAVIFDLDDTLYLEKDYVKSGFMHVSDFIANKFSHDKNYVFEQLLQLFNEDKNKVFNRYLEYHGLLNTDLEMQMIKEYRFHTPTLTLSTENVELLHWLRDQGFKIGLITDGRPEGQRGKIKALCLNEYCDHIIVTDELGGVEYRKPNQTAFINMLLQLNIPPEEAVYVGDNPAKDFVAGNRLGMHTIMLVNEECMHSQSVRDSRFRAKSSVQSLNEIRTILESRKIYE